VQFTVDAYPGSNFAGTVSQVRLQPTTTSNVVTYTVIIAAPNPELKLMPGMTASLTIYTLEKDGVLAISAKALRFKPDPALLQAYFKNNKMTKPPADRAAPPRPPAGRYA
jgi:HlyD family secretion protein